MRLARSTAIGTSLIASVLLAGCAGGGASPPAPTPSATSTPAARPALPPVPLPEHPVVYFFGDSWTSGASAAPGRGFPQVVGEALDWEVRVGPNNSGAGYVHTYDPSHPVFPERAEQLDAIDADLVVIEGGLNDQPGPLDGFWSTMKRTIEVLQQKSGGAPVVVVGPASPDGSVSEGLHAIDYLESGVASQLGLHYVSPVEEAWLTPETAAGFLNTETFHLNTAGHAYYAGRLAAALRGVTTEVAPEG